MSTRDAQLTLEWSVAGLALTGGVAIAAVGASYGLTNVSGVGAGFFPLVAGALMGLAGAMWIAQLLRARAAEPVPAPIEDSVLVALLEDEDADEIDDDAFPDRQGWIRVGTIVGSILAAALLLPILGYTLAMTLQLTAVLFLVSKRKLWLAAVVSLGAALASRLVFEVWLGTALPSSSIDLLSRLGL